MHIEQKAVLQKVDVVFLFLFVVSFFSGILATIYMLLLLYYNKYGIVGSLKVLILLTVRGLLSAAVASVLDPNIKWIVLLSTSLWIVLQAKPIASLAGKINRVIVLVGLFAILVGIVSFFVSSYPITSLFKMISFVLPFIAVIKGLSTVDNRGEIINFVTLLLSGLFVISLFLLPFAYFRTINDDFQGVFNHVNMCGIMSAVYISFVLVSSCFKKSIIKVILVILALVLCYFSASRTGMFSCIIILITYLVVSAQTFTQKIITIILGALAIWIFVLYFGKGTLEKGVTEFLWKNSNDSIFDSRLGIIEEARERFQKNKAFGTGFMVPYKEGLKNYELRFDLIVEPGNLVYMLLGDTGILGLTIFSTFALVMLLNGKISRLYLFVGAFVINFGEMVFFSSNNMSVLLYLLLAIYLFGDGDEENNELEHNCAGI